jgi:hypothetical protein
MKNIKNIVWILTDSQHAEAVGYVGNKAVALRPYTSVV